MDILTPQNNNGQTNIKDSAAERIINQLINGNAEDQKIGQVIGLIHSCSNKISQDDEKAYMVLGLTGAGKTTLTAYLSGVDLVVKQEKLGSTESIKDKKEDSDDSSDDSSDESSEDEQDPNADRTKNFLDYKTKLKDYGKIGGSDLESETTIPNKFVSKSGSIFWDCPGFQDSRGQEIDIANSYYISKISKNAQKIKFILVIDGSCLEQKGFGSNKGDSFKVLLETIFQMSKDTTIDYSKQLSIIITRVSKSKNEKYFKQKLEKLFSDLIDQESFLKKLKTFFKKSDFEKFFDKLKKARVCLFRQPKGKEGDDFSDKYRKKIQKSLDKTEFYTGVNISVPHSIRSLERMIDLWKYTRGQLSSKFQKLSESLGTHISQMSANDYAKVSELIKQFEANNKNNLLTTNSEFLSIIKNQFVIPLTKIIEERHKVSDESKEMRKNLMEDIEFFLVKVYDELLLGVRLSSETQQFFGRISYFEIQEGFSVLYKAIETKKSQDEEQKKKLEEELRKQAELRDLLDKQQQQQVQDSLKAQQDIQKDSQSTFTADISTVGTIAGGSLGLGGGMMYGASMGSALGPVGTLFGGLIGGIAGSGLGGFIGNKFSSLFSSKSAYEEQKDSNCSIF